MTHKAGPMAEEPFHILVCDELLQVGGTMAPAVSTTVRCKECGHPWSHHDANECWTRADGTETQDDDSACDCWWPEPEDGPTP